jgi:S1-C subfamily serine protease
VAHQLADLGVFDTAVLLTVGGLCEGSEPGIAEAVFVTGGWRETAPAGPRLGVMIEAAEKGVLVREVIGDSVAEATGIAAGDVIFEAAGLSLAGTADLIAIVRRQAPGTWLPLVVLRADSRLELVAKFPTSFR